MVDVSMVMAAGRPVTTLPVRWFAIRWLLTRWFESVLGSETIEVALMGAAAPEAQMLDWLRPGRYMLAGVDAVRPGDVDLVEWQAAGALPIGPTGDRLVKDVGEMAGPGAFGKAVADRRVSSIRLALDLAESFRAVYQAPWWQRVQLASGADVFTGFDAAPLIVRMIDDVSTHLRAPRIAGSVDVMRMVTMVGVHTLEEWDRLAATVEDDEHREDFVATGVLPTAAELGLDAR